MFDIRYVTEFDKRFGSRLMNISTKRSTRNKMVC